MKFRKTTKKFIDEDCEEIDIIRVMDTQLNDLDDLPPLVERHYDSIITSYMRHGRLSPDQYNKLVEIYREYCEHDDITTEYDE